MSKAPNIVFILTDQQRYDSLGVTGNAHAVTPHLDALAREGTLGTRFCTASSVCMPSRAALLTGLYPAANGLKSNGQRLDWQWPGARSTNDPDAAARSHFPTLPEALKGAGYRTASIGKLHVSPYMAQAAESVESYAWWDDTADADERIQGYLGFDHVELTLGHDDHIGGSYRRWLERGHPGVAQRVASAPPAPDLADLHDAHPSRHTVETHHTTWCAERASAFIEQAAHAADPFFLWVGIPDPHHPFTPPEPLAAEFAQREVMMPHCRPEHLAGKPAAFRKQFASSASEPAIRRARQYTDAMNHLIDTAVGRILRSLETAGCADETIIVFTSDHGDYLGDFGGLRKSMHACAALNHVPLIVRASMLDLPAQIDCPLGSTDLLPTLCHWAGVEPPSLCQGHRLEDRLGGDCPWPVLTQNYAPGGNNFTLHTSEGRTTLYPETGEVEYYALASDPHERHNLPAGPEAHPLCEEQCQQLLRAHAATDQSLSGRLARW